MRASKPTERPPQRRILHNALLWVPGLIFVFASPFLPWVDSALRSDPTGLGLLIGSERIETPFLSPASYGGVALLIGCLYLLFRIRVHPPVLFALASAAVLLSLIAPLQIAYGRPEFLHALLQDGREYHGFLQFSREHLGFPVGSQLRDLPATPPTLLGRILVAGSFLHLGWILLTAGGVLLTLAALLELPKPRERGFLALGLVLVLVTVPIAYLVGPLGAQWQFRRALLAQAEGRYDYAIEKYRKAQRVDAWHALQPETHLRIGELQAALGAQGGAELLLHQGRLLQSRGEYEEALVRYRGAAQDPALGPVAARIASDLLSSEGMTAYGRGSPGTAASRWKLAVEMDPARIDARLFLARAQFDLAEYAQAIAVAESALQDAKEPFALAVLYSLLGDCHHRLRHDAEARRFYSLSIELNPERRNPLFDHLAGE